MSYKANGDFIKEKAKVKEHFNDKIIEHWEVDKLLYTANGNVGIGTNNPQKKLDVNGDIRTKKICFINDDGTDEKCIDYSIALLTTEMLRSVMPDEIQDLNQLSSMNANQIDDLIQNINDTETENTKVTSSDEI